MLQDLYSTAHLKFGSMALLLALSIHVSSPVHANPVEPFIPTVTGEQAEKKAFLSPSLAAQEFFQQAYAAYCTAKPMTALGAGSEPYAEAISAIAQATTLEPENVDYLLLASQIYRGKGGISYAKEYFSRAESILQEQLLAQPDSIDANLEYAILCYAGDVRYWPDYDSYREKAKKHAEHVIALYKRADQKSQKSGSNQIPLALAFLIKGDNASCEKLLAAMDHPTAGFYYELYEETVKKNEWFWPAKDAGKEFLLYYMTDPHRHNR